MGSFERPLDFRQKMSTAPVPLPNNTRTENLRPPKLVSPNIRAARWGALIVGFFYGAAKWQTLAVQNKKIKAEEDDYKKKYNEKMHKLIAENEKAEMAQLAKDVGVSPS